MPFTNELIIGWEIKWESLIPWYLEIYKENKDSVQGKSHRNYEFFVWSTSTIS